MEQKIDMAAFTRMLAPHIAPHLADDRTFIRDMRAHLAQTGSTYLMADEAKDGQDHTFTLADVK